MTNLSLLQRHQIWISHSRLRLSQWLAGVKGGSSHFTRPGLLLAVPQTLSAQTTAVQSQHLTSHLPTDPLISLETTLNGCFHITKLLFLTARVTQTHSKYGADMVAALLSPLSHYLTSRNNCFRFENLRPACHTAGPLGLRLQTHRWMKSQGTRTYGPSHVEQSRIAWEDHGNPLAPVRTSTAHHLGFYNRSPSSFSTSVQCPIPVTPLPVEWEVSSRAGTDIWQCGWRWRLPRSFSMSACVPPSQLRDGTCEHKKSTDVGHVCLWAYSTVCRVEAILWGCLQYMERQGLLLLLLLVF